MTAWPTISLVHLLLSQLETNRPSDAATARRDKRGPPRQVRHMCSLSSPCNENVFLPDHHLVISSLLVRPLSKVNRIAVNLIWAFLEK